MTPTLLLQEEIRPQTLDNFIGNDRAVDSLRAYFRGYIEGMDGVMLISDPGLGKTTLAHLIAKEYGYSPLEINGSAQRNKKDILRALRQKQQRGMTKEGTKPKLLIVDECEPIRTDLLKLILDSPGKKILICNEPSKINYTIKKRCHLVKLEPPDKFDIKEFWENVLHWDVLADEMLEYSSFRDCINAYYGGDPRHTRFMTELQEAQQIFIEGPQHDHYQISTDKLLEYYIHNGGDQQIASRIHLKLNENAWWKKVIRDILFVTRLPKVKEITYYGRRHKKQREKVKFLGFDSPAPKQELLFDF